MLTKVLAAIALSLPALAVGTWHVLPKEGAPSPLPNPSLLWTGDKLAVLGETSGPVGVFDGGFYDPKTQTWAAIPEATFGAAGLKDLQWAADRLVVFAFGGHHLEGHVYDPKTTTWTTMSNPASQTLDWTSFADVSFGPGIVVYPADDQCHLDVYWPETNRWQVAPPNASIHGGTGDCPSAFFDAATRRVYLLDTNVGVAYDIDQDKWSASSPPSTLTVTSFSGDGVVAGGKWLRSPDDVSLVVTDLATGTVTELPKPPLPEDHVLNHRFVPLDDHTLFSWGTVEFGDQGARYPHAEGVTLDLRTNQWHRVTEAGAPAADLAYRQELLGSGRVVLFNGLDGGIYDHGTGKWTLIHGQSGYDITGDSEASLVWTGSGFFVWGGILHQTGTPSGAGSNDGLWLDLSQASEPGDR